MSRRGLLLVILASAFIQIGLVTAGKLIGEQEAEGHALPEKMWQSRLYFPLHDGDETIAPPRVIATHFPGPLP
jgi:hypothetical protein